MSQQFVVISGNIGVGKSTLTRCLSEALGWQPFYEAFDENPYLADFYADMPRWSFHSQIFFLSRRLQHHHALVKYPGDVIQDRSVYEDAEIFARNLYLQGMMSERDYGCYRDLYEGIASFLPAPTLLIYLQADVDLLLQRIAQRGREYERQISADYLRQLNTLYDEWAQRWRASPVLRVQAAQYDFLGDAQATTRLVEQIKAVLSRSAVPQTGS